MGHYFMLNNNAGLLFLCWFSVFFKSFLFFGEMPVWKFRDQRDS